MNLSRESLDSLDSWVPVTSVGNSSSSANPQVPERRSEDFLVKIHTVSENRWRSSKRLVNRGFQRLQGIAWILPLFIHVYPMLHLIWRGELPCKTSWILSTTFLHFSPKKGDDTPTTLSRAQRVQHHTHAIRMGLGHPILSDILQAALELAAKLEQKCLISESFQPFFRFVT